MKQEYYYLKPTDIIQQDDEVRGYSMTSWLTCVSSVGQTVEQSFGADILNLQVRRKIKQTKLGNQL